jgi:hypothetical protein
MVVSAALILIPFLILRHSYVQLQCRIVRTLHATVVHQCTLRSAVMYPYLWRQSLDIHVSC